MVILALKHWTRHGLFSFGKSGYCLNSCFALYGAKFKAFRQRFVANVFLRLLCRGKKPVIHDLALGVEHLDKLDG